MALQPGSFCAWQKQVALRKVCRLIGSNEFRVNINPWNFPVKLEHSLAPGGVKYLKNGEDFFFRYLRLYYPD